VTEDRPAGTGAGGPSGVSRGPNEELAATLLKLLAHDTQNPLGVDIEGERDVTLLYNGHVETDTTPPGPLRLRPTCARVFP